LKSTIRHAGILWCVIQGSGRVWWVGLVGGLTLEMTIKLWIWSLCSQCGMCLKCCLKRGWSIGEEGLCLTPMPAILFFLTFRFSRIIRK
jgi:hypothetical protein